MVHYALCRAIDLIIDFADGKLDGKILKIEGGTSSLKKINLRYKKILSVAGIKIPESKILKILKSLDIKITSKNKNELRIEVPNYRHDVTREIDVIEEILRIYGYNNIPSLSDSVTHFPDKRIQSQELIKYKIVSQIIGLGFNEVVNNSIISLFNNYKRNHYSQSVNIKPVQRYLKCEIVCCLGCLKIFHLTLKDKNKKLKYLRQDMSILQIKINLLKIKIFLWQLQDIFIIPIGSIKKVQIVFLK